MDAWDGESLRFNYHSVMKAEHTYRRRHKWMKRREMKKPTTPKRVRQPGTIYRGSLTGAQLGRALDDRCLTRDRMAELTGRVPHAIQVWVGRKREKTPLWFDRFFDLYDKYVEARGILPDDDDRIFEYLQNSGEATFSKISSALDIPAKIVSDRCDYMIESGRLE